MSKKSRELSDDEKLFLENVKAESTDSYEDEDGSDSSTSSGSRKRPKRIWPWQRLSNWAAFVMLFPVAITLAMMYFTMRAQALLGSGTLEWLAGQEMTPEIESTFSEYDMGWLSSLLAIYDMRGTIIIVSFAISTVIAGLLLAYDLKRYRSRLAEGGDLDEED